MQTLVRQPTFDSSLAETFRITAPPSPSSPLAAPSRVEVVASPATSTPKLKYRPEIDGLRAFAVLPVVLFHLNVAAFCSGNLGVDVFFVISGFLITSIVKHEADTGTFSFAKFWARRVRRIMPAMIAVTAASLLFTVLFVYRPEQMDIGRQAAWAQLSAANFYFWKFVGNYWGFAASQSPFLHMWSLAVEEQFYLFMPPAVWLIYKFAPRSLLPCILTVAGASLALFLYLVPRKPDMAFYLLPPRAWELAAGCALAVVRLPTRSKWTAMLGAIGLATVVTCYFLTTRFGATAVAVVTGALLVIAFAQSGVAYRLLANRPAVYVGKLSYSLYLWHWPIIVFPAAMQHPLPLWLSLVLIAALTLASYYLIEKPTRHAKRVVPFSLAALAVTTAAALYLGSRHRLYNVAGFDTPQLYIRAYDSNPTAPAIDDTWSGMKILPSEVGPRSFKEGGILSGHGTPQVVVLGDSHGTFWAPVVHRATDKLGIAGSFWVMSGVDPFFTVPATGRATPWYISSDDLLLYDQSRIRLLKQWKPRVVVIAARWSVKSAKQVTPFLDYVSQMADHVLLIEQPPELPIGNRNVLQYLCYEGVHPHAGVTQYHDAANAENVEKGRALLRTLAATYPNCRIIPTYDLYAHDAQTRVLDGRQVVYMDDDHLTDYGASLAGKRIEEALAGALKTAAAD